MGEDNKGNFTVILMSLGHMLRYLKLKLCIRNCG